MNYYEHHIGDYAEATAHLSFVEDAAYSRLIRKVYATEKPLPADIKAVQRLVGARSKEERVAVETVLHEFFSLQDDGVVIFSEHPSYPYTTVYRLGVIDSHVKAGNGLVLNPNTGNASEKLALVGFEDLKTVLRFAKSMQ